MVVNISEILTSHLYFIFCRDKSPSVRPPLPSLPKTAAVRLRDIVEEYAEQALSNEGPLRNMAGELQSIDNDFVDSLNIVWCGTHVVIW